MKCFCKFANSLKLPNKALPLNILLDIWEDSQKLEVSDIAKTFRFLSTDPTGPRASWGLLEPIENSIIVIPITKAIKIKNPIINNI